MKWVVVFSLYCMCVIKCLAMSQAELEDFSIFLQETSQLDQKVKSKDFFKYYIYYFIFFLNIFFNLKFVILI